MALFGQSQPSRFGTKPISPFQKPLSQKPVTQKSLPSKPVPPKPAPAKPKTLFEEKKDWTRAEFQRKVGQSPYKGGGKTYSSWERKKMINEEFPSRRFSTYISEGEVKTRLRELRGEEYRAKTGVEKAKLSQTRKYLEGQTGLKGKY